LLAGRLFPPATPFFRWQDCFPVGKTSARNTDHFSHLACESVGKDCQPDSGTGRNVLAQQHFMDDAANLAPPRRRPRGGVDRNLRRDVLEAKLAPRHG